MQVRAPNDEAPQKSGSHARPTHTVGEVLRRAVDEGHVDPRQFSSAQTKVLWSIRSCRTAALGGHAQVCLDCDRIDVAYNSCRNRHCPQCQWSTQQRWIEERHSRLLDTHYFHVVFTLPAQLRPLAMCNPRAIYTLLFHAASKTLMELGRDPKHLGAELGLTAVLHTWTRNLHFHPHVHMLVTGGGLALDGSRWVSARQKYLFPVKVMGSLFRGKFLDGLHRLHERGELRGVDDNDMQRLIATLHRKDWVVYSKRPMLGPEQVIKYLGRYTHRVGISSRRIRRVSATSVTFVTRDKQTTTISIAEFTRRLLLHVLPKGFTKIRHYGLFAAANIATKWTRAHQLRPTPPSQPIETMPPQPQCETCGSTNHVRLGLRRYETIVLTSEGPRRVFVDHARGPPAHKQQGGTP